MAAAAVGVLLAAGCGDEPRTSGDDPATTVSPTAEIPTATPTTLPDPGELTGVPERGVEAGCWLLDGYLLLGGDETLLASGQQLRVTGHIARDVLTTCQQGTPFQVETVEPVQ